MLKLLKITRKLVHLLFRLKELESYSNQKENPINKL